MTETPIAKCIATGDVITADNNSEAHVIPNAIGGRLKPRNVLTRVANSGIGDLIEAPFLANYQQIMWMIGGTRQRGEHPPFRVSAPDGKDYLIKPDGTLSPARPEYRSSLVADGERVEIVARTFAELRTLLGRVKAKHPHFDIEEAIQHAQTVSAPSPTVKHSMNVGPNVYFPLAYAAAATFNSWKGLPVHPGFKDYYQSLRKDQYFPPPDTFYWEPDIEWVVLPHAGIHVIATIASPSLQKAITIVRLIGLPGVAVIADYCGTRPRAVTYAVDVVKGVDLSIGCNAPLIAGLAWNPTHQLGDNSLYKLHEQRMNQVCELAQALGFIR